MKVTEIAPKPKKKKKLRVAAYARVSSDKDAAFHSLEAQRDYYEKYVATHPDWELIAIYSDNGISGTIVDRPAFQEMLQACRDGKIDLVVTKSVTRFARNTVVLLETIRELKSLNIDCYFEKERMHSISSDGELFLTLLAMYAEEEARSASENQRWRIQKKFEKGEAWTCIMLGYRLEDGHFVIVPDEAEIVKQIFSDYLSGMGCMAIARKLQQSNAKSRYTNRWSTSTIQRIIRNEKYIGDMLLQKTYCTDFRTKKCKDNHGEVRQYYVTNSHEPIIDKDTFEKVQKEIERRRAIYYPKSFANKDNDNPFRGLIICGNCGSHFLRKTQSSNGKIFWRCNGYIEHGKNFCSIGNIHNDTIEKKALDVLGLTELTPEVISERIKQIIVPEHKHLLFILNDGSKHEVTWEYPSRSKSWSAEMKDKARQRLAKRQRKEDD